MERKLLVITLQETKDDVQNEAEHLKKNLSTKVADK